MHGLDGAGGLGDDLAVDVFLSGALVVILGCTATASSGDGGRRLSSSVLLKQVVLLRPEPANATARAAGQPE